jgi:amidophosphoribosyltransferase
MSKPYMSAPHFLSDPFDDDKLKEECGIFGVYGHDDAAALTVLGLHALQHRGQEASGIVSYNGADFNAHRAPGLVDRVFKDPKVMEHLKGHIAIGHNRYATTGGGTVRNIQPLFADLAAGGFAIAHNGNLTNAMILRRALVEQGAIFQSTSDTEVVIHLIARSRAENFVDRFIDALSQIQGAYSFITNSHDSMMGVRDPQGVRPLVLGRFDGAYVLASETCALDIIGAEYVRDIEAGELVIINKDGLKSLRPFGATQRKFCIFEYIYFARPDSYLEGHSVYEMRKQIGAELAREAPVAGADLVVPVPDSGTPAAIGYAQASGVPFELGIIRNHYVGRTFIQPGQSVRNLSVKMKHNANRAFIEGKSIILVDDSIVRGTTSKKIVDMVRAAGAKEVHLRISSPPTAHSCFYGIDTPRSEELLANRMKADEIREFIGADSVAFISLDGLYKAAGEAKRVASSPYCDACFSGDYPIDLLDEDIMGCGGKVSQLSES